MIESEKLSLQLSVVLLISLVWSGLDYDDGWKWILMKWIVSEDFHFSLVQTNAMRQIPDKTRKTNIATGKTSQDITFNFN